MKNIKICGIRLKQNLEGNLETQMLILEERGLK